MGNFRSITDPESPLWSGGDLIQLLTEHSHLFLFSYSPALRCLLSWSGNAKHVLGVKDSTIAKDANLFLRHVHPDDRFLLMTELEEALSGKKEYRATYRWIRPDTNELRWLHCRASLISREAEKTFEGMVIDLSNEFTGSVSRFAGPDSLATVLDAFSTMVFLLDSDLRLVRINRPRTDTRFDFGDRGFKHENLKIGRRLLSCFSDEKQKSHYESEILKILEEKSPHYRTRIYSGETVYSLELAALREHETISGILGTVSDITELVRLERQLSQLQKTEGLRLLAAGISHNFNNALQSILGQATVIYTHPKDERLLKESAQAIMDMVGRASQLTKQLYSMDTAPADMLVPVDLNLSVMAAVNRIEDLFHADVKIGVAFGNPSPVLAKQEQIIQAVEAILRNAKESVPANGNISIKTYDSVLSELEVADLRAGSYAVLSVSDTGSGMASETQKRCLEPFYTTKECDPSTGVGIKGGGLGLSSAFGIVRSFKGALVVESNPGLGTSVSLYMPAQSAALEKPNSSVILETPQSPNILVIDDDLMVLQTMKALISDLGYASVVAHDCNKAINLLSTHGKTLKLILLDAIMPGMNGVAVLKRLKKIRNDITVVGFSGAPPEVTKSLLDAGAISVLRKPVAVRELKDVINLAFGAQKAA